MKKFKLKINLFLSMLFIVLNVCESNVINYKKCQSILVPATNEKGFICDSMSMTYVNENITRLTATEKITRTPITLKLIQINFARYAHKSPMLPKNFFKVDVPVKTLSMQDMLLYSIERDAFNNKQFYQLKILEISRIPIMNFLEGIFNGLNKLEILTLDHVLIHKIEPNLLQPLSNLQSISIKYCGDQIINIDNLFGFVNLTKLRKVMIEFCNLKDTITNTTFSGLKNIRDLSLRYNQIEQIGPKSFNVPLKTLNWFSLDWNELKLISGNLFQSNRQVGVLIQLTNNPWHCDCKMENLRQFIRKFMNVLTPIICKTPSKYNGMLLENINDLCNGIYETKPIEIPIEFKPVNEVNVVEEHPVNNISHRDKISVQCKLSKRRIPYLMEQTVHLSIPLDNAVHPVQNKNGKFILDSKYFPVNFSLIGFEEPFNNTHKKASNCFINKKDTEPKKVIIKSELIPNRAFQFCWANDTNLIVPLNCMPFHWFVSEDIEIDYWLTIEHEPILITISIVLAVVVPFIGILIACILAKVFPRQIRGRRPMQTIASFLTPREIEAVKQIRHNQRPMIQMSSVGLSDVPPPLPPRNNTSNSSNMESEYCELS